MEFDIVFFILVISLVIIIYKYFEASSYDVVMVKSNINGTSYLVRNLQDKQEAADLLARISIKLEKLVEIINTQGYEKIYYKYLDNEVKRETDNPNKNKKDLIDGQNAGNSDYQTLANQMKNKLKDDIERLVNNFNPNAFSETTPDAKYTSYSVNKGEKIVFCMRDKNETESLVKENIMTFVAIHELAHLMSKSIGHGQEFWANFRILLRISIGIDQYKCQNFNGVSLIFVPQ